MDKYKERFSYRKNPFGCAVLGQAGCESVKLTKLGNYGLRLETIVASCDLHRWRDFNFAHKDHSCIFGRGNLEVSISGTNCLEKPRSDYKPSFLVVLIGMRSISIPLAERQYEDHQRKILTNEYFTMKVENF